MVKFVIAKNEDKAEELVASKAGYDTIEEARKRYKALAELFSGRVSKYRLLNIYKVTITAERVSGYNRNT